MKHVALSLAVLLALPALAQVLVDTPRGIVVAHDGRIALPDRELEGVRHATAIVADDRRIAVLDSLHDEVVLIDNGRAQRIKTATTPIAAAFVDGELYVLARDARLLQHIGGADVRVAADPAFLRVWNGRLYVYSRATGSIEEIDRDRVTRRVTIAPHASDFEIGGGVAYLTFPHEAKVRTVGVETLKGVGEVAVGSVPVDLAFAGGGTAITARILAVADPSAKRVWLTEGTQSTAEAFGRGVLRGLLGLGLFGDRDSQFPTGVDRVLIRGKSWIAYDSSSRTLYRFTRKETAVVARNVAPHAFALTANGVAWWDGTSVAEKQFR